MKFAVRLLVVLLALTVPCVVLAQAPQAQKSPAKQKHPRVADYRDFYLSAAGASAVKDLIEAVRLLQLAIQTDSEDTGEMIGGDRWAAGPYYPHYLLGEAFMHLGDCQRAVEEFNRSESGGAIEHNHYYYDSLMKNRRQCSAVSASTPRNVERVATIAPVDQLNSDLTGSVSFETVVSSLSTRGSAPAVTPSGIGFSNQRWKPVAGILNIRFDFSDRIFLSYREDFQTGMRGPREYLNPAEDRISQGRFDSYLGEGSELETVMGLKLAGLELAGGVGHMGISDFSSRGGPFVEQSEKQNRLYRGALVTIGKRWGIGRWRVAGNYQWYPYFQRRDELEQSRLGGPLYESTDTLDASGQGLRINVNVRTWGSMVMHASYGYLAFYTPDQTVGGNHHDAENLSRHSVGFGLGLRMK